MKHDGVSPGTSLRRGEGEGIEGGGSQRAIRLSAGGVQAAAGGGHHRGRSRGWARALGACIAALSAMASPAARCRAQDAGEAPLLSLDEALATARQHNHALAASALAVDETNERTTALRTRRLPALHLDAFGGRLLNSLEFGVPGALGLVPQLGPSRLGVTNYFSTTTTVPADWFAVATVSATQPLTQQYRIGLSLDFLRLDHEIAQEDSRRERQRITADVRSAYYQISATEAGIVALRDTVRAVEELDVVTSRYLQEEMVLRSDALEVRARLARERQRLTDLESSYATQRERLNELLGRDIHTPFRVSSPSELSPPAATLTLDDARERARASRPEIKAADLRTTQADVSRRIVLSQWIPDVSLQASYTRLDNFQALPDRVGIVGLLFSWEPFDWGRKKHEATERRLETERSRELRAETEQGIVVEVGQRWRAVQDAAALLEATRLEVEASRASLETDQSRYRESAAILRDLLRTEARLSQARREYTAALADYWSAAAELERVVGNES